MPTSPSAATYSAVIQHDAQGRAPGPGGLQSVDINLAASGDTVLVPAVAGTIICVFAYRAIADSDNQVGFKDGAAFIEGPFRCGATNIPGGAAPAVPPPYILFKTSPGNALIINLGAAVHVGGGVSWWRDTP